MKQIRVANENEVTDISDFVEKAPVKKEDMVEKITQYIFEMRNPNIQRLTRHLLNKHQNEFLDYPAATKNHHEFVSGLAYHVVSMLDLAKAISNLYPSLDKDLLYAGVILHDLGKVIELSGPNFYNVYVRRKFIIPHFDYGERNWESSRRAANRCRRSINSSTHRAFSSRKSRMG